jgi:hypothetical protein
MQAEIHYRELEQLFKDENLALPPLPAALARALKPVGPHHWSTREALHDPLNVEARVKEVRSGVAPYLELGFTGHGINSWQLYFNLVQGPLALFVQCRWGNAYDDVERARRRIQGVMGFAGRLVADAQRIAQDGPKHGRMTDETLIVCFGDHFPSRWQWKSEGERWQQDGDFTLLAAAQALRARSSKRGG